jgi:hypothetical protein
VRLVCPYTPDGLRKETMYALAKLTDHLYDVEMVDVSERDESYAELLAELWTDGEDFCLIEHDIVPTIAAIDAMDVCPKSWCANAYAVNHQVGEVIVGLGFTRFRGELCRELPDAVFRTGRWQGGYPRRHWARCDARLTRELNEAGHLVHRHHPDVGHLHLV